MCLSAGEFCFEKNYSYQHIQGVLLVNLNIVACKLALTNAEYRIMATIISKWNVNQTCAYPALDYLANVCKMSKSTITRSINTLSSLGLLKVFKGLRKQNLYFISKKLFSGLKISTNQKKVCTAWKTPLIKQIKKITSIKLNKYLNDALNIAIKNYIKFDWRNKISNCRFITTISLFKAHLNNTG
ncbi:MAG: helix-turn-helix domain-containing protein [Cyanobacteriota bacterium]